MRASRSLLPALGGLSLAFVTILVACANSDSSSTRPPFEPTASSNSTAEPPGTALPSDPAPCVGMQCQVPTCPAGKTTVIEGDVYDPAAKTKLYNVLAYVPDGDLAPLAKGASCDQCGKLNGKAVTTALSDEAGHFRLEGTPAGDDIPVVVQVGKFRRKITVPHVEACATTTIKDKEARLPKNQIEGDLPKVAAVTGGFDELYCLLLRVGIDATEHTTPDKPGAVHVYRGKFGPDHLQGGAPDATTLWNDEKKLSEYDIVLLGCEGAAYDGPSDNKSPAAKEAMRAFTAKGGRIFATHYQSTWVKDSPEEDFKTVATWRDGSSNGAYGTNVPIKVDTSFPKGVAFDKWLTNVGVKKDGVLHADNVAAGIASTTPNVATRWLYREDDRPGVTFMSFNTPVNAEPAKQCGRAVISDLHFGQELSSAKPPQCGGLITDAGLALEFLLFDLSACVQPDSDTPRAPK